MNLAERYCAYFLLRSLEYICDFFEHQLAPLFKINIKLRLESNSKKQILTVEKTNELQVHWINSVSCVYHNGFQGDKSILNVLFPGGFIKLKQTY